MSWEDFIPSDISQLYDVYDYKHAAVILSKEFPVEFNELCEALLNFRFTQSEILESGGNESKIPKKFSQMLRPKNWLEKKLEVKFVIDNEEISRSTHKVDYFKGRVAFDLEWNSKDQTFDRDLFAFSAFYLYDKISVGVLITRSTKLNPWFSSLGGITDRYGIQRDIKGKYGASTTHMDKLIPRLEAGRSGGCPVLAFGITPKVLLKEQI